MILLHNKEYWTERFLSQDLEVNWSHPISASLQMCIPANHGAGHIADIAHRSFSRIVAPTWQTYKSGLSSARDWSFARDDVSYINFSGGPFTIGAYFEDLGPVANSNTIIFGFGIDSGFSGYQLMVQTTTHQGYSFSSANSGSSQNCVTVQNVSVGTHFVVGTLAPTGAAVWYNGLFSNGNIAPIQASTTNFGNKTNLGQQCPLYVGYIWNRLVTGAEIFWLNSEPWAPLTQKPRIKYLFVPPLPPSNFVSSSDTISIQAVETTGNPVITVSHNDATPILLSDVAPTIPVTLSVSDTFSIKIFESGTVVAFVTIGGVVNVLLGATDATEITLLESSSVVQITPQIVSSSATISLVITESGSVSVITGLAPLVLESTINQRLDQPLILEATIFSEINNSILELEATILNTLTDASFSLYLEATIRSTVLQQLSQTTIQKPYGKVFA